MTSNKTASIEAQQKTLEKFEKSLKGKTFEELTELEQKIIAEADKADKKVADTKFDLPDETYKEVAKAIRYFINKKTVQWQYTLAMQTMYDFWDEKNPKKISYATLDSTLRTLGEMQFTGIDEWRMVIVINKYFEPLRTLYVSTTQQVYDIASKHSAVIKALELQDPSKANTPANTPTSQMPQA